MEELLRTLLNRLDQVGSDHEEVYDTECRGRMNDAIMEGFVRQGQGHALPSDFGLFSDEGNLAVRHALAEYIASANEKAAELRLTTFHERLAAFQNEDVKSDEEGHFYDDFFGYADPQAYDSSGKWLG